MASNFVPQTTLRCQPLRTALKAYIVPPFARTYNVIAIRALWSMDRLPSSESIWQKRRELEVILLSNDNIVAFFSCITALVERRKRKKRRYENYQSDDEDDIIDDEDEEKVNLPGLSFWIACDWPEYGLQKMEIEISKQLQAAGLNIERCKAIRSRGK